MLGSVKASERIAVLAVLNPVSQGAGTVTTAWAPVAAWDAILAILQSGALGTNATVDAKLQQAQDAAGTGVKDVTGKALTQWLQATADKSNKQAIIQARVGDLDVANNFTHVRLSVTVAVAASLVSAVVLGIGGRRGTASGFNAASVAQVVA